jgi:hypothetical protein
MIAHGLGCPCDRCRARERGRERRDARMATRITGDLRARIYRALRNTPDRPRQNDRRDSDVL